jgi:hypothetical protein
MEKKSCFRIPHHTVFQRQPGTGSRGLVPLLYRIFRQDREQHLRQNGHHEQTNAVEHRRAERVIPIHKRKPE